MLRRFVRIRVICYAVWSGDRQRDRLRLSTMFVYWISTLDSDDRRRVTSPLLELRAVAARAPQLLWLTGFVVYRKMFWGNWAKQGARD